MGATWPRRSAPALFALAAFACAPSAWAQSAPTIPSEMIVGGNIRPATGAPAPATGTVVDVIDKKSGATVASGTVENDSGDYAVTMTEPTSFDGTALTMQAVIGCTAYQLVSTGASGGAPVGLTYNGSFPFPTLLTLNPKIGAIVSTAACAAGGGGASGAVAKAEASGGGDGSGGNCPASLPNCKVSGDGHPFDQADIDAMRKCLTMSNPPKTCDTNGDGVVDSRDLIDLLRAYTQFQRQAGAVTRTVATPAAASAAVSGSAAKP